MPVGNARIWVLVILSLLLLAAYLLLRKRQGRLAKSVSRIAITTLTAIVVVFLIMRPFVLEAFVIPSPSMSPTLEPGDQVLVNKFIYKFRMPRYREVVVFVAPDEVAGRNRPDDYIKRVIGLPGDRITVFAGAVYRNGHRLNERYIREPIQYVMWQIEAPAGTGWVMGDNRNNSSDSHVWGPLETKRLLGRATVVAWPPRRIGYVR